MRSTLEIICAVKECRPVTEEELRLALVVMTNMEHFVRHELHKLIELIQDGSTSLGVRATLIKDSLDRLFHARKLDPVEWLGAENIPGTPEYAKRQEWALKVLGSVEKRLQEGKP